ncbi:MAG: hypothetical protein K6E79_04270 [Pseudobutyrivibrio sp.]|nr:hypothetical protein [Pseudobutyrivibrio sp.]
MDLVEIFEVIVGAAFVIGALIGSRQIFGGIFYSKKVRAVVGKKNSRTYVRINGQTYTGRTDMSWAEQRDRRRHKQMGDRKKQRYREHTVYYISFTYEDGGEMHTTDPQTTICPISKSLVDTSAEYNIMVSRRDPCRARLGLFEILRVYTSSDTNIIMKFITCIIIIGNALLLLVADLGLAALGAWIIKLGIYGIR